MNYWFFFPFMIALTGALLNNVQGWSAKFWQRFLTNYVRIYAAGSGYDW